MKDQLVTLQGYTHMVEGTSILQMNEALDVGSRRCDLATN